MKTIQEIRADLKTKYIKEIEESILETCASKDYVYFSIPTEMYDVEINREILAEIILAGYSVKKLTSGNKVERYQIFFNLLNI